MYTLFTTNSFYLGTIVQHSNIFELIWGADWIVKGVLLVLLFLSIISWGIIFLKLLQFRKIRHVSRLFLEIYYNSKNFEEILSYSEKFKLCPANTIFLAGNQEFNKLYEFYTVEAPKGMPANIFYESSTENLKRILEQAIITETTKLERFNTFLATTGSSAPFIGLFGTVWGIMNSFRGLINATGSQSISVVAPGISEALIATAVGLFAAIPAVIAYNFFIAQVRLFQVELENFGADYLNRLQRQLVKL